jgi:hypothetical protein
MARYLCISTNVIGGVRYKEGRYYNFDKRPNPRRFMEASEDIPVKDSSKPLSAMTDLLLSDEEREMVLAFRKAKNAKLDEMKMEELRSLADARGVEVPKGIKKKDDLIAIIEQSR